MGKPVKSTKPNKPENKPDTETSGMSKYMLPLGMAFLFSIIVGQIGNMIYSDFEGNIQNEKVLGFMFYVGALCIMLSGYLHSEHIIKKIMIIRGVALSGILLLLFTLILNWSNNSDHIKLVGTTFVFLLFVFYLYSK